jgi:ABC-2 type transport system permease protein
VLTAIFSLGMMLASVAKNSKSAGMLCSLLYFPMLFLSGAAIPFEVFRSGCSGSPSFCR